MFDALGDRMKKNYENRYRIYLTRRTPVIIRVDGNAFHTFTKGLDTPFDSDFMWIMQQTCLNLCENIQGCVGGYVQSDEISLLLIDYQNLNTDAWFDYNLQKITSITAARATMVFNDMIDNYIIPRNAGDYQDLWRRKRNSAMFDSRAFNIPKEEVCNYFIWRQKDAVRNSIQSVGQAYFSHKELDHKSQSDIQEMLFQKQGINWNNYSISEKRGTFVHRFDGSWCIDYKMPILTENREYIDRLIYLENNEEE